MKIVFPEYQNIKIQEAISRVPEIDAIDASSLENACKIITDGVADAMVAGIDHTSRDVILACRDGLGIVSKTFTSSFVMRRGDEILVLADVATCKNPTEYQLFDIVTQTYETAKAVLNEPKIAMLSFSTLGSGGHDDSMTKIQNVVQRVHKERPDILIDGEMQLDAAVVPEIALKKAPGSPVAGKANVLICPDLNSGNILYKALERFGGFTAAGPILQGFNYPVSDLSRGSTVEDIVAVIKVISKIAEAKNG